MLIDPNNRLFDRVPTLYDSPYPGADIYADDAFKILMQRVQGQGGQTVGESILSQAGAQAWNRATQMLWKTKATIAGDLLGDTWSKVAWIDGRTDAVAGMLAEVAFAVTSDPDKLLAAMSNVAIDIALNAVSAIPVAGWIIGIVVGIGRALAALFRGAKDNAVPPEDRARLPWSVYNREIDQEWVRTFINIDAAGVDWTPMFAPPTDAIPWQLLPGVDKQGSRLGSVLAPFANKTVAYNGMYGCLPGTSASRASCSTAAARSRPPSSCASTTTARSSTATAISRRPAITSPPCSSSRGPPGSRSRPAARTPTRSIVCAWRSSGATGSRPSTPPRWSRATPITCCPTSRARSTANGGSARTPRASSCPRRTTARSSRSSPPRRSRPALWPRGSRGPSASTPMASSMESRSRMVTAVAPGKRTPKTGVYTAPPLSPWNGRSGTVCVGWPPADLLLSKYRRVDDAITTPAIKAVAQLQQRRLRASLDCAYVRPVAVKGAQAYAAFNDKALRDLCLDMRKRLLTHPARMEVEYETAREVDPEYADALKTAGVPTTPVQRAAAKMKLAGASTKPLDPAAPLPARPLPLQGGLPFDPNPEDKAGSSWLKPAIYGGAALVSTIAIAVGVARARST
jgi:hypothetical protein